MLGLTAVEPLGAAAGLLVAAAVAAVVGAVVADVVAEVVGAVVAAVVAAPVGAVVAAVVGEPTALEVGEPLLDVVGASDGAPTGVCALLGVLVPLGLEEGAQAAAITASVATAPIIRNLLISLPLTLNSPPCGCGWAAQRHP
ncbi:MAG: hypothetical protein M1132_08050 [Chloroflexi bacterium]|nr:hypothetical protein [Chloroflexota bacterium]